MRLNFNMNIPEKNNRLIVDGHLDTHGVLSYEMQPVVDSLTSSVFGYELLFRGEHPADWKDIDYHLLNYLGNIKNDYKLFINISNDGLLQIDNRLFEEAAALNNIIIELSESETSIDSYNQIARKVNCLSSTGVTFALDDFGSGHDGFHRLYALNSVSIIKLDGSLIQSALARKDAMRTLTSLVEQWNNDGILSVAECIESKELYECAKFLGVDLMQGWYIDNILNNPNKTLSNPVTKIQNYSFIDSYSRLKFG
jgi:EAL domain-containing protein (putative c-di-GMP-specific phosphodiesterase class I)